MPSWNIYKNYRRWKTNRKHRRKLQEWMEKGKPVPPPHIVKRMAIQEYAQAFSLKYLVETGTYHGEMVEALLGSFEQIFSIELDRRLHDRVRRKFSAYRHVTILHGDSGEVLKDVLSQIHEPAIFWLDGHYSGDETAKGDADTPIMKELDAIFTHPFAAYHVILIDDARCFDGTGDYPSIRELERLAGKAGFDLKVQDDIIRMVKDIRLQT